MKNELKCSIAIHDIMVERARQDEQWGGAAHDDEHDQTDWLEFILKQVDRSGKCSTDSESRKCFVKIAALSIAGIEAMDRFTNVKSKKRRKAQ